MPADLVPFDEASHWRRHDAYFAARGIRAWTDGDIPSLSTNNYPFARQVAALVLAHAGDGPVSVLEVGGGLGTFAANFLAALEGGLGDAGRALLSRLQYSFSDYAEATLREATEGPELHELVASGRVRPLLLDARAPRATQRFSVIIANYLCCVLPAKHLRKRGDAWWQLGVRAGDPEAGVPAELAWMPVWLDQTFAEPLYARVATRALAGMTEGSVSVPHGFLDFHRKLRELVDEGGLFVVNDYGTVRREQLRGHAEVRPRYYGESVNQDVSFAVFEDHAAETGGHALLTTDPVRSVHTALLSSAPFGERTRRAFAEHFVDGHAGQELLDQVGAGRMFLERDEHARAARSFRRAAALDPRNPELWLLAGTALTNLGFADDARACLERGRAVDLWGRWDFDFEAARAHTATGALDEAIAAYRASLTRAPHPTALTNLGSLLEAKGDRRGALAAYRRALEIEPKHPRGNERLAALKELWWAGMLRGESE